MTLPSRRLGRGARVGPLDRPPPFTSPSQFGTCGCDNPSVQLTGVRRWRPATGTIHQDTVQCSAARSLCFLLLLFENERAHLLNNFASTHKPVLRLLVLVNLGMVGKKIWQVGNLCNKTVVLTISQGKAVPHQ